MTPLPLHPMSAGDLLDEAIRLYRHNFWRFVLMGIVARVPLIAFVAWLQSPDDRTGLGWQVLGWLFEHALLNSILMGVTACAVADLIEGKPIALWRAYGRNTLKVVWYLINYLTVIAPLGVLGFGLFIATMITSSMTLAFFSRYINTFWNLIESLLIVLVFVVSWLLTGILPALGLMARWAMTVPVIALEHRWPVGAMRRSVTLAKGHYRRVMVVMAGSVVLTLLISTGPWYLAQLIGVSVLPLEWRYGAMSALLSFGLPQVIDTLFKPIPFIAYALVYYDLRVRNEGYDLLRVLEQNA